MSDGNEIEQSLTAYLVSINYRAGLGPLRGEGIKIALSDAYLAGYGDGLTRGNEIANSAMDTALEAMREHYPEITNNALRNYLSRPEDAKTQVDPPQGLASAWSDTHPAMTFHTFKGRLDRDCELCGKPDRDTIHVHANRE